MAEGALHCSRLKLEAREKEGEGERRPPSGVLASCAPLRRLRRLLIVRHAAPRPPRPPQKWLIAEAGMQQMLEFMAGESATHNSTRVQLEERVALFPTAC